MHSNNYEFLFVHSYSSNTVNWQQVQIGSPEQKGRILAALDLGKAMGLPVVANDGIDMTNHRCFELYGIENLRTARNTTEEVESALRKSKLGRVIFLTSPDHLPRVAREALARGAYNALFASSEVSFSREGARAVKIIEPPHAKHLSGTLAGSVPIDAD